MPTYSRGHTLDVVITNSLTVKHLFAYDMGVSDHKVVCMELPFLDSATNPKQKTSFRNLRKINSELLATDLKIHIPVSLPVSINAVDFYNTSLASILDHHAPVRERTVTFSRSAPWFTPELRKM